MRAQKIVFNQIIVERIKTCVQGFLSVYLDRYIMVGIETIQVLTDDA
jgi:hypothetical protein